MADQVVAERGAASIVVDLKDGVITVTHGTDNVVLQRWVARQGDWDRIWDTINLLAGVHPNDELKARL